MSRARRSGRQSRYRSVPEPGASTSTTSVSSSTAAAAPATASSILPPWKGGSWQSFGQSLGDQLSKGLSALTIPIVDDDDSKIPDPQPSAIVTPAKPTSTLLTGVVSGSVGESGNIQGSSMNGNAWKDRYNELSKRMQDLQKTSENKERTLQTEIDELRDDLERAKDCQQLKAVVSTLDSWNGSLFEISQRINQFESRVRRTEQAVSDAVQTGEQIESEKGLVSEEGSTIETTDDSEEMTKKKTEDDKVEEEVEDEEEGKEEGTLCAMVEKPQQQTKDDDQSKNEVIESQVRQIHELKEELKYLNSRQSAVAQLESALKLTNDLRLQKMEKELRDLRSKCCDLITENELIRDEKTDVSEQLKKAEMDGEECRNESIRQQSKLEQLHSECDGLKSLMKDNEKLIDSLQTQKSELESEKKKQQKDYKKLKKARKKMSEELDQMRTEMAKLSTENECLRSEVKSLRSDHEHARKALVGEKQLLKRVDELAEENGQCQATIEELKHTVEVSRNKEEEMRKNAKRDHRSIVRLNEFHTQMSTHIDKVNEALSMAEPHLQVHVLSELDLMDDDEDDDDDGDHDSRRHRGLVSSASRGGSFEVRRQSQSTTYGTTVIQRRSRTGSANGTDGEDSEESSSSPPPMLMDDADLTAAMAIGSTAAAIAHDNGVDGSGVVAALDGEHGGSSSMIVSEEGKINEDDQSSAKEESEMELARDRQIIEAAKRMEYQIAMLCEEFVSSKKEIQSLKSKNHEMQERYLRIRAHFRQLAGKPEYAEQLRNRQSGVPRSHLLSSESQMSSGHSSADSGRTGGTGDPHSSQSGRGGPASTMRSFAGRLMSFR